MGKVRAGPYEARTKTSCKRSNKDKASLLEGFLPVLPPIHLCVLRSAGFPLSVYKLEPGVPGPEKQELGHLHPMQLFDLVEGSYPRMVEIELKKSEGQFSH